jgi:hypothetical protein
MAVCSYGIDYDNTIVSNIQQKKVQDPEYYWNTNSKLKRNGVATDVNILMERNYTSGFFKVFNTVECYFTGDAGRWRLH